MVVLCLRLQDITEDESHLKRQLQQSYAIFTQLLKQRVDKLSEEIKVTLV